MLLASRSASMLGASNRGVGASVACLAAPGAHLCGYRLTAAGDHGIQFETNVAPYSIHRTQGGLVTWPKGWPGVIDEPNDMVCIPITAIALRY